MELEEFWDVVWKEPGGPEETETYDDYDEARADYVNMANGNHGALDYVILRKVETNWCDTEDIEILDRTDEVPGKGA